MVLSSYYPSVQQHPWVADLIGLAIKGLELRPPEKVCARGMDLMEVERNVGGGERSTLAFR
jgi:hypothetical protein